jgi:hypothetical protein
MASSRAWDFCARNMLLAVGYSQGIDVKDVDLQEASLFDRETSFSDLVVFRKKFWAIWGVLPRNRFIPSVTGLCYRNEFPS